jgi:hypothetical protein
MTIHTAFTTVAENICTRAATSTGYDEVVIGHGEEQEDV